MNAVELKVFICDEVMSKQSQTMGGSIVNKEFFQIAIKLEREQCISGVAYGIERQARILHSRGSDWRT
jgi:hypothetical protein